MLLRKCVCGFAKQSLATVTLISILGLPLFATGWQTSGVQILNPSGSQFVITGVNWYGFETTSHVAHGLYTKDYRTSSTRSNSTAITPFASRSRTRCGRKIQSRIRTRSAHAHRAKANMRGTSWR